MQGYVWRSETNCPSDWALHIERCGGGFHHSPLSLPVGFRDAEPIFASLWNAQDELIGLACGARRCCRLGLHTAHLYFPSLPAFRDVAEPDAALRALVDSLEMPRVAEIEFHSFGSTWTPNMPTGGHGLPRLEHVVPLTAGAEETLRSCGSTHRRWIRKGEREGWDLRRLGPADARAILGKVRRLAARRARKRGEDFASDRGSPWLLEAHDHDLSCGWGLAAFAATDQETVLAAILVGWAGHKAYYLMGGSTPQGYRLSAAFWLHWRVMALLAEHGCTAYNLGGTPEAGGMPEHPAHGLFRFKKGFGSEAVRCRGARWVLRPGHVRAHRLARALADLVRPRFS